MKTLSLANADVFVHRCTVCWALWCTSESDRQDLISVVDLSSVASLQVGRKTASYDCIAIDARHPWIRCTQWEVHELPCWPFLPKCTVDKWYFQPGSQSKRSNVTAGWEMDEEEFNEGPEVWDGAKEERQSWTLMEKSSPSFRLISKD